ncbi:hypothetical protein HY988_01900 [Candidatus Micrarchaeota archaeon]|nr:hypothetical protein [Candidatus Micrarchaeota archaeon]
MLKQKQKCQQHKYPQHRRHREQNPQPSGRARKISASPLEEKPTAMSQTSFEWLNARVSQIKTQRKLNKIIPYLSEREGKIVSCCANSRAGIGRKSELAAKIYGGKVTASKMTALGFSIRALNKKIQEWEKTGSYPESKRKSKIESKKDILRRELLALDRQGKLGGLVISLSEKEFIIVRALTDEPRCPSRRELQHAIYDDEGKVQAHKVYTLVLIASSLRKVREWATKCAITNEVLKEKLLEPEVQRNIESITLLLSDEEQELVVKIMSPEPAQCQVDEVSSLIYSIFEKINQWEEKRKSRVHRNRLGIIRTRAMRAEAGEYD